MWYLLGSGMTIRFWSRFVPNFGSSFTKYTCTYNGRIVEYSLASLDLVGSSSNLANNKFIHITRRVLFLNLLHLIYTTCVY